MRVRARLAAAVLAAGVLGSAADARAAATYRNPLPIATPTGERLETFADPAILVEPDGSYVAYGTSDPLHGADRDEQGALRIRLLPFARSTDLVTWTYQGDALARRPAWAAPDAGIWAPDIRRHGDRHLLYFTVTDTADAISGEPGCATDSAIGVAVAASPDGPFEPTDRPVVAPRRQGPGCDFAWTYDPAVTTDRDGGRVLYYGSYDGGVEARRLAPDGLTTDPATATRVTVGDRFEGTYVVRRGGWWYLMGSATDCCRGPLTGYSVLAGRARSPFGPFRDRLGARLDAPRAGGTPVISMNGNRWVGTGHHAIVTDAAGQDWIAYHAIDRHDPYLAAPNPHRIQKRPLLLDRLTWHGGWPQARGGAWASDEPQPATVTAAGGTPSPEPPPVAPERPGRVLAGPSDAFAGRLEPGWSWVREPAAAVRGGALVFPTQPGDVAEDTASAPLLVRDAPPGDLLVEAKVAFDVPPRGVFDFQQAALLLYVDDDRFVKLAHVAIGETRQTEWAKEVPEPATPDGRRYGNTVVGPPGPTTWLRIVRRAAGAGEQRYTAFTSRDGRRWVRGGTWTHDLPGARIALTAMGGAGHTARFEHLRVHALGRR